MVEERAKRKLSAILSADVKGYSRLMGVDETGTVNRLKEYRALMTDIIQQYRGRVVDSPGDNILSEFSSVVDATECAVKIQEELKKKNSGLPDDRKMEFRIGINLGDVIEDGERIYGDGVNIAARVEGLAKEGGVCISGSAYEQVENKLSTGFEYLGEHAVKNIAKPIRVYRVLTEPEAAGKVIGEKRKAKRWLALAAAIVLIVAVGGVAGWYFYLRQSTKIEPASAEKMAYPLPDKPSIAVLPFDNLSGVPDQEYLADGITENIITALSYIPDIFVIARNSTFTYKGKAVKAQEVAEDLGVRYILEGSVQRAGDRLRIMAQLIDAASGRHLWADRYDRDLQDLFALQDEITLKIVLALEVKLSIGVQTRLAHQTMPNFEAWSFSVRGSGHMKRHTKADNARARELFERAASLAPEYARVFTLLGLTHFDDAHHGWSESREASLLRAVELAKKALALDDSDPMIHILWGAIYLQQRRYDQAIAEGQKSVALGPNQADPHLMLAKYLHHAGRYKEALPLVKKAMRLDPYYPSYYLELLGHVYLSMEAYEKAVEAFKVLVVREPHRIVGHRGLAMAYIRLGRKEKARSEVTEILRLFPKFSLEVLRKQLHLMDFDPALVESEIEALREAGLPEYSPIALPDKPSMAVLPFVNMSGDPEQEYFSDGLTEDLITDLSKFRGLFVISRNSVFTYKGQAVKPEQVRKDLGVRYMLEGSVRKAGKRVRITAQLIDTTTGGHLWAERYDRELKDIFTLQDEITQQIVSALDVKFEQIEQERALRKDTANLNAFDYNLQGWWYYHRYTKEDNELARRMFEKATEIEPKFANAYAGLGFTYYEQWAMQWRQDPQSLERAFELAKKAISLNDSLSAAYTLLSRVYLWRKQHAQAIAEQERAIALNPNDANGYADLAEILVWAGRPEEALGLVEKAMRLNPHYPVNYLFTLGFAYSTMERYEEAMVALKRGLTRSPDHYGIHLVLSSIYSEIGREEEARAHVAEALRINPQLSIEVLEQIIPFKDTAIFERMGDNLRRAGLK
jgi:adenylate cyclase